MWERDFTVPQEPEQLARNGADSPCYKRGELGRFPMQLDFDPREPGSRRRDRGNREDPGRRALALCPLRAAAGPQGNGLHFPGPR